MAMEPGPHLDELNEAIAAEREGYLLLLAGDAPAAATHLRAAAAHYRDSWKLAPPRSYGRLIGALKAAVIAGDGPDEAAYARAQVGFKGDSPSSWYVLAIAALIDGDDALAALAAEGMRAGSPAFVRAADAIAGLAAHDVQAYAAAVQAIVEDFEGRDEHLTGVAIVDTALMLDRLAKRRGMAVGPRSTLLPTPSSDDEDRHDMQTTQPQDAARTD
jgi:hypothetical protein